MSVGSQGLSQGAAQRVRVREILRRVWAGVVYDGTIHAGNFAYMVLIALIAGVVATTSLRARVPLADRTYRTLFA